MPYISSSKYGRSVLAGVIDVIRTANSISVLFNGGKTRTKRKTSCKTTEFDFCDWEEVFVCPTLHS